MNMLVIRLPNEVPCRPRVQSKKAGQFAFPGGTRIVPAEVEIIRNYLSRQARFSARPLRLGPDARGGPHAFLEPCGRGCAHNMAYVVPTVVGFVERPDCIRAKSIDRLLNRCATLRRVIHDVTDVNDIHLPSQTFVRGIYGYYSSVPADPRMQVNTV